MEAKTAIGVTIKVSENCELVDDVVNLLEETCSVLHKSRNVYHERDTGCHIYIDISEVMEYEP